MADLLVVNVTPSISVTVTGAYQTLLQVLAPSNQRLRIVEASISFQGTSNTASPILCEVLSQSTAGTGGNAATLGLWDEDQAETIQSSGQYGVWSTTEPTAGVIKWREYVHPQTGFLWQPTYGREGKVKGGGRVGIRIYAGAAITCVARLIFEE